MQAYPIPVADYWSGLKVASARFKLTANVIQSRNGAGEVLTARQGARLWTASVSLAAMRNRDAEAALAYLDMLSDAGATMMAYPMPTYSPAYDPDGTLLAGSTPTISTLAANGVDLRISGLPSGYVLARGEFLSFAYGGRNALHRIVSAGGAASGSGVSPLLEVRPAIRPGAEVGLPVTLFRPTMKALIVPGSINHGSAGPASSSGPQFEIIQTLR